MKKPTGRLTTFREMAPEDRKRLVGQRLRALREQRGKTQAQVAETLGVVADTYRGYEAGRHEPALSDLPVIALGLGLSACDLCSELFEPAEPRPAPGEPTYADIFVREMLRESGWPPPLRAAHLDPDEELLAGIAALVRRYRERVRGQA